MCGRFTLRASPRLVEEAIGMFSGLDDFKPRFNIAPTQSILVLHHREGEEKPRYARMRWTFVGSHHDSEAASAGECSSVAIGRCPQRDSGERVGKCHHRGRIRLLSWRSRTQRFGKLPKKTTKQTERAFWRSQLRPRNHNIMFFCQTPLTGCRCLC